MSVDKKLWENWKGALQTGCRLSAITTPTIGEINFGMYDDAGDPWSLSARPAHLYCIGCDIVGYLRRSER